MREGGREKKSDTLFAQCRNRVTTIAGPVSGVSGGSASLLRKE